MFPKALLLKNLFNAEIPDIFYGRIVRVIEALHIKIIEREIIDAFHILTMQFDHI